LNLTTRAQDDDGQTGGRPTPPDDYEARMEQLQEAAMGGTTVLERAWKAMPTAIKAFTANHNKEAWTRIKIGAAQATKAAQGQ